MEDMEDDVLKEFIIGLLFVQLEGLKNFMEKMLIVYLKCNSLFQMIQKSL